MRLKNIMAAVAASSLAATPVLAAPTSNPASSLSVANARVGSPSANSEKLGGGAGFIGLAILGGIVAIVVLAAVNNDDDNSDSN